MELHPPLVPSELDESVVAVSVEAADFLTAVAREHARFIGSSAGATSLLADSHGWLAPVAASHGRSIQQFLDAQRALLAMWAETDARVARIAEATELDLALLGVELSDWRPGAGIRGSSAPPSDMLDGGLRILLDEWWADSNRRASLLVEETRSRSAALLQVARSQVPAPLPWAAPVVGDDAGPAADSAAPCTHLPASIVAALDAADVSSLDAVLATLLQQLADPAPDLVPDPVAAAGEPGPDRPAAGLVGGDEAFDRFWGAPRFGHPAPRRSLFAETLFAVGSVVAVLTAVLAWIG